MLKSMTGYGFATQEDEQNKTSVEVKTLNSKFLDCSIRLPRSLSDKEIEVKGMISESLVRGKVNLQLDWVEKSNSKPGVLINHAKFASYYKELKQIQEKVGSESTDLFRMALNFPDVTSQDTETVDIEQRWAEMKKIIVQALDQCDDFRKKEGKDIDAKIKSYVDHIEEALKGVREQEGRRAEAVKAKLKKGLNELMESGEYDKNRFEQELIYYIEKLDIHEEMSRLAAHIEHFREILDQPESNGKKLGFISQEMGREINTLGSKANDSGIQRMVVEMKEELEKIKEQLLNVV